MGKFGIDDKRRKGWSLRKINSIFIINCFTAGGYDKRRNNPASGLWY